MVEGTFSFGPVAAGASPTSLDTFTIRRDRTYPYTLDALVWSVVPAAPSATLTSVTPASGARGQTLDVALVGAQTHRTPGASVGSFGAGLTVTALTAATPFGRDCPHRDRRGGPARDAHRLRDDRRRKCLARHCFTVTPATSRPSPHRPDRAIPGIGTQESCGPQLCLLPSAFYLLPSTFCLLPSTFWLLPSAFYFLPSAFL
jgi:hypothetical protein